MIIPAHILQQAIDLYLKIAYPEGPPPSSLAAAAPIRGLPPEATVPLEVFEKQPGDPCGYAIRLGQPLYPFMKLAVDPTPHAHGAPAAGCSFLLRVDAHDRHLHAPPGSPDAAWLSTIRASNLDLSQKIEAAWAQAGLPTFKEFLRQQLEQRRAQHPA